MVKFSLKALQETLLHCRIPAWLFYDFLGLDPLALRILKLSFEQNRTRRWFYLVPDRGNAVKIVHRIEPDALADLPGETLCYSGKTELEEVLKKIISPFNQVAMQYSPNNAVPYVSRVDAGTVELVKSLGVKVVSSGDLIQLLEATWSEQQLRLHREAANFLYGCVFDSFDWVRDHLRKKETVSELSLQEFLIKKFRKNHFIANYPPIVAVNSHTGNPHYSPHKKSNMHIRKGSLLLLDLWCKKQDRNAPYADITWVGYIGKEIPEKIQSIFHIVREARDKAIDFIRGRTLAGHPIFGYEVDDKVRHFILAKGYGEYFLHRTGHSIGSEVYWIGANLDNFETEDHRQLLPKTCFSVEPGIYLKDFGIRSEVNIYIDHRHLEINPPKTQDNIIFIPG